MRTKTLLKQDPAKPNAALDAKTARRTGIDRSCRTPRGLRSSSSTSMMMSVVGSMTRGSSSSTDLGGCAVGFADFLGRVLEHMS